MNDILTQAYLIKELLDSHPLVLNLNIKENALEQDETMKNLYRTYQEAQENYHYFWSINPELENTRDAQKKLAQIKEKVDGLPVVKQYIQQFALVRQLYEGVNEMIFKPFLSPRLGCKI